MLVAKNQNSTIKIKISIRMSDQQNIIDDFLQKKVLLEAFKNKIHSLLTDLLQIANIQPHQITCRVKEIGSLVDKIERKEEKYKELKQITDLVGLRIITYFDDDVDKIATLIENEFEIDMDNSVDKRIIEADKFGYSSLHYVVSLTKDRLKFIETEMYRDLKAEIQIRSILQHAWAEIEHDIGYKGEIEIPKFAKRGFSRISALLETADIEFVKLKESIKKYESEITENIENKPETVLIDKASLINYVYDSPLIIQIEKEMQAIFPPLIIRKDPEPHYNTHLRILNYLNITTIKDLISNLNFYKKQIPIFFKKLIGEKKYFEVTTGIPIFYLGYILVGKSNNVDEVVKYCKNIKVSDDEKFAQSILEVYNSTNTPLAQK